MNMKNAKTMKLPTPKQIKERLEKARKLRLQTKGCLQNSLEKDSTNKSTISITLSIDNPAEISIESTPKHTKDSSFFKLVLKRLCKWDCFSNTVQNVRSDFKARF
ncbi:unnamed protein product [Blepharisma stoltei]|uniref:Uncharacterized protein n=1 Tax=Blepharisma stoltei TaxID=1481888 RepID=A0AAU9JAY4_9CILI|nr:unnamed protein product [Blepharisma stoltei]